MQQIPALALRFVEALNGAQARTFEHLTSVGRRSARERVANLLLELVMQAQSGPRPDDGRRLAVPLMQAHIADALGLAPETVCRALTSMRKDGIVVLRAQRLEVLDIGRLAREAGMEIDRASTKRMGPAGYAARHVKTAAERVAA
jgi:CRP-like cAMP-binding protein